MISAAPETTSQSLTRWKLAVTQARPEAGSVKAYCVPRLSMRSKGIAAPFSSVTEREASS